MGVFATLQMILKASADFDQTEQIFDTIENFSLDSTFLGAGASVQVIDIANLVVEQVLQLGGVGTIKLFIAISDGALDILAAPSGTPFPIGDTSQNGFFAYVGSGLSTILVSNSSGGPRKLRYIVGGTV